MLSTGSGSAAPNGRQFCAFSWFFFFPPSCGILYTGRERSARFGFLRFYIFSHHYPLRMGAPKGSFLGVHKLCGCIRICLRCVPPRAEPLEPASFFVKKLNQKTFCAPLRPTCHRQDHSDPVPHIRTLPQTISPTAAQSGSNPQERGQHFAGRSAENTVAKIARHGTVNERGGGMGVAYPAALVLLLGPL